MADDSADVDKDAEANILYDLTVQEEWRLDPESTLRYGRDKALVQGRGTAEQSSAWNFLWAFGSSVSPSGISDLPSGLVKLINSQINWKFSLTPAGDLLAILQDNFVEIRTSENEFTTLRSKWPLPLARDLYPQWRCLGWNRDGSLLAASDSCGQIEIFDPLGGLLCHIPSRRLPAGYGFGQSLCALIFKELRAVNVADDQHWFTELLAINFQGFLTAYLISQEGDFRPSHTFDFMDFYPDGVGSVVYHHHHSLLVIGGSALSGASGEVEDRDSAALSHGIGAWRILSGLPYYKRVTDYNTDRVEGLMKRPLVKRFRSRFFGWSRDAPPDGVFKLSLSPSGCRLACVHYSGLLTLWDVPSLRLTLSWPLESQPGFDQVNEDVAGNPKLRKRMKEHLHSFFLVDVGWWSDKALILARGNGAVVVSSVESLQNLLGLSPEWFEPMPVVAGCTEGSFLGLECESKFRLSKRHLDSESNTSQEEEQEEDTDDESDATVGARVSHYIRQGLYYVTDSERFQPPRKRQKLIERTYRLVCLKSTTPEELYARKIDNEEYGEALALAQSYHLDSDLVYQRQWRKSPVSVATIQDYLTKIGKRSWVLHECLERVTEDFDAMNELLKYGLQGTDLEALVIIGRKEDKGRFIFCQADYDVYHSLDIPNDDFAREARDMKAERKREWLKEIDFNNLSLEQQELCRIRLKLLQYTDRLMTYQAILGGMHVSAGRYDPKFFEKFRSQNVIEMAVEYARAGDAMALDYLFTYHGKETLPHRLIILGNFPETLSPDLYVDLLPEISSSGDPEVVHWLQDSWRELDWCEENYTAASSVNEDYLVRLYEEQSEYKQFWKEELMHSDLTEWYKLRASEIEMLSGLVDNSLQLVKLAITKNLQGLSELLDDLLVMETLIYECRINEGLTLSRLRKMSDIEKLRLMMSRSSEEMYLKNFRKWVVPFLRKCDGQSPGSFYALLREYLVGMATDDLVCCTLVFRSSNASKQSVDPIIADQSHLMSIALDCIYACKRNDQLDKCFEIHHCLPQRINKCQSEEKLKLFDDVDELKNHLMAAEILERNGLPQQISFIRDTQSNNEEAMKILTRITRTAARQQPPVGERKLKILLEELSQLTEKAYRCIGKSKCYQVFVESLLCSGCPENIEIAGRMLEHSAVQRSMLPPQNVNQHRDEQKSDFFHCRVSYAESVQLVLAAAREYFDSSATLNDSDMQLARTCLGLIADQNAEIEAERDLIEAVSMLEGFCVSILPVQVRICKDKLQLVQKAIAARPSAYRNSQRLVRLGKFLRVGGDSDDETRGQVLRLVAGTALQNNDYKSCYEACALLMEIGYAEVWRECRNLAELEEYSDIQAKLELLSFAVVHCSPDMIESILRAKQLLQTQLLCDKIHARIGDRATSPGPSSPLLSHRGVLAQTKDVLSQTKDVLRSTNKATQSILLHISNSKWWKKTVSGLHLAKRDQNTDDYDDLNIGFQQQSCHPFYETVFEKCYSNRVEADYVGMHLPRTDLSGLTISEGLLRTAKLEETVTEGQNVNQASQVLLRLAEDVIVQDSMLGLAYLLALPDPIEADLCFAKIPSTKTSLQLAAYYYGLQILSHLMPEAEPELSNVYRLPPEQLTQKVIGYIRGVTEQKKDSDWPDIVKKMAQRLVNYNELLLDYVQAQTLGQLDRGVDVSRFVQDDGYKRETILGMVLCLDDNAFKIASSLAARHRIPVGEVYMAHLEHLFEDSSLSTEEIESRIQALGILQELKQNSEAYYVKRMEANVYPMIEGTDLNRLLLYYTLLSQFSAEDSSLVVSASAHVKLLKKIRNLAHKLNYRRLTDGSCDPLEILSPVLNHDNINAIAKLASSINGLDGRPLTASNIYRLWAVKLFWEGFHGKEKAGSRSEWIPNFELFWDSVQKMDTDDFISFILNVVFSLEAVSQLSIDCRRQILRRTLKHAKQQQQGSKRSAKDDIDAKKTTWDEAVSRVQKFLEHIDRLNIPFILEAKTSTEPLMNKYAQLFDLTCSQTEKVEDLLVTMALDGQSVEMIEEMRRAVSKIGDFKLKSIVQKALSLITAAMKNPSDSHSAIDGCDLAQVMKRVVSRLAEHQNSGGNLVKVEDVISVILPFCADQNVNVEVRLGVLDILSKTLRLGPDDQSLILLNQTQAMVSMIGVNVEVTDAVRTDNGRQLLFDQLLSACDQTLQLKVIKELLDIWPELQSTKQHVENPAMNVWCQLVDRFLWANEILKEPIEGILPIVISLCARDSLSAACVSYVSDHLLKSKPPQPVAAAKCLLVNHNSSLHSKAIEILKQLTEDYSDEDLFSLILKRHLVTQVIPMPFYASLVDYILSNQCTDSSETPDYIRVNSIARQMQDAGYQVEAGTLVMQFRSTHRSLRTFDAAFSIVSNLFRR